LPLLAIERAIYYIARSIKGNLFRLKNMTVSFKIAPFAPFAPFALKKINAKDAKLIQLITDFHI